MLGRQSSDLRLHMKRSAGGRGLKSLRKVYEETRLQVACYMVTSEIYGSKQHGEARQ